MKRFESRGDYYIALAGNPNVGKSTVFNALTGMNCHTGNWTGKTVDSASSYYHYDNYNFKITDLPGAYSLLSFSDEEKVTRDILCRERFDCVVIVADANNLERSLCFALQVMSLGKKCALCLNLCDEAESNGIFIDESLLSRLLDIPVVKCVAKKKRGLEALKSVVYKVCESESRSGAVYNEFKSSDILSAEGYGESQALLKKRSKDICEKCVKQTDKNRVNDRTSKLDRLLTSKRFGIPAMLLMLGLLFWITIVGANYPSEWLSGLFSAVKAYLNSFMEYIHAPKFISGLLIDGVYTTLSWVAAVMLPPMAIFFPLFSLIEDSGYLPRIAFNMDSAFARCGAHGKQCLTMAMGIGCNACGVTGCRIIENKRERTVATVTNSFMPCNGRFPILIAVTMSVFAHGKGASSYLAATLGLLLSIIFAVAVTFGVSKILTKTVYKGEASQFLLELPPYRKPQIIKTIVRSLLDKTLAVLGRAAAVAAPAGAVIWLFSNIKIGDISILRHCTSALDGFGHFIGLDGAIIMAFVLGFPANEIVIPIIVMAYTSGTALTDFGGYAQLSEILAANDWSAVTGICMMIFTLLHFPCSTTCLTIKKETGSLKTTLFSIIIPLILGVVMCMITANAARLFGF